jgi:hypothetical protein
MAVTNEFARPDDYGTLKRYGRGVTAILRFF